MDTIIDEYKLAMQENIDATKAECDIKIRKQKAHYRLLRAKEELRSQEREVLDLIESR